MATSSSISESTGQGALMHAPSSVGAADQDVIVNGDFRIDLRLREATVRGRNLSLTDEELELLVFLMGHPKSIITPQTRLTTRWGSNRVRQAEFMRVLAQLRKKLESIQGSPRYIRTEPWLVYCFDPHNRDEVH
jgi:two-component system, OmpR family, KDP operon response regulator KdpE